MDKYKSLMDFIFCELFPIPWRWKCFQYYNNRGCQLKDDPDFDVLQLEAYDNIMSNLALPMAVQKLNNKREIGWSSYRKEFQQVLERLAA
jgi:hypothetical protein